MAAINSKIIDRARQVLDLLQIKTPVTAAYLFGSQVDGTADRWSDIDIAVFINGVETWNLQDRVHTAARIQKTTGDDIDIHFFPATFLLHSEPASFSAWILKHGIEIKPVLD